MSTLGRTLGPASRGSTFLAVMRTCDIEEQVRRIDSADRVARLKGSDPEGYRHYTLTTQLFVPPTTELLMLDTTTALPGATADAILTQLRATARAGSRQTLGRAG